MSPLRVEAAELVNRLGRVASIHKQNNACKEVFSGCPQLPVCFNVTPNWVNNVEWAAVDFGATVPHLTNDPIFAAYGKSLAEKNKRPIVHLDAALVAHQANQLDVKGIEQMDQVKVFEVSSRIRG